MKIKKSAVVYELTKLWYTHKGKKDLIFVMEINSYIFIYWRPVPFGTDYKS